MTERTSPPFKPDDTLHDEHLDALWAATRTEGPPPEIDAALHAAARRAVSAGPVRAEPPVPEATRPERWWTPLAAAAAIGAVALGLLQLLPDERSERAVVSDMPAGSERKLQTPAGKSMAEPSVSQPAATAGNALHAPAISVAQPDGSTTAPGTPPPATPARAITAPASPRATTTAPAPPGLPMPAPAKPAPAAPAPAEQRAASSTEAAPPVIAPEASPAPSRARNDAPLPFPLEAMPQRTASPPSDSAARDKDALARVPTYRSDEKRAESGQVVPSLSDAMRAPAAATSAQREAMPAPAAAPPPGPSPAPAAAGAPAPASPPASAGALGGTMSMAKTMKKQESDDAAKSNVRPVDEWIVLIRRLRDERHFDEAAKELAAFRTAYPDADRLLPPDLRDWRPPSK